MRFLKFAKLLICLASLCVCPVLVYADVSCPTGYELVDGVCKLVPEFTITTTDMPAKTRFEIQLSAAGSYVIDCGNDDVKILDKTNTNSEFIVCEYPDGGVHDIKISGKATAYNNTVAAISFEENPYIKKLGGSLGAIFSGSAPHMFNSVFYKNTSLEFVPSSLFAGISGSAPNMFRSTFNGCSSLKSVPAGLFAGVSGGAEYMFYLVFSGCTELKNIPENLFAGVSVGGARMFHGAFNNCSSLVSIPGNIFSGLNNTGASYMFSYTFQNCASLLSIPEGLFAGISNAASNMFIGTFMGCTSLTKLPNGLFMNISGSPAQNMFDDTFSGCKKLSGYIPSDMFKNLSSSAFAPGTMTNIFANTSLYTSCPANMYQFTTGFESAWSGHVACASCPEDYPNSDAGATGVSQCYTTCEHKCTQRTCPDNATCVSQNTTPGRRYHNRGYCTEASYACPIDITCNNGYIEKEPLIPVNISENASGRAWDDSEDGGGAGNKNFEDADYVGTESWAARFSYGDVYGNISCGKYCRCRITRLVSAEGTIIDVQSSAPSVELFYAGEDGSAAYECSKQCASGCAGAFSNSLEYRQEMLGVYPNYCIAGRKLNIGDDIQMILTTVKPQTPRVMVFDVLGELYYGGLSDTPKSINKNTDKQFRILDGDTPYWMHDYTVK